MAFTSSAAQRTRRTLSSRRRIWPCPKGSLARFQQRLALLGEVDRQRAGLERLAASESFDRYRQNAISLLADASVYSAFGVTRAEPAVLDRYGRNVFGWSLLMAKRLVAAGVSLVQVNLGNNETWDTHQSMFPILKDQLLPPTDRALSALLDDLAAEGLLDSTLVVMAGEFGRTAKISTLPGAAQPGAITGAPYKRCSSPAAACAAGPSSAHRIARGAIPPTAPSGRKTWPPRFIKRSASRQRRPGTMRKIVRTRFIMESRSWG